MKEKGTVKWSQPRLRIIWVLKMFFVHFSAICLDGRFAAAE